MRRTLALGVAVAAAFLAWSAEAPPDWITVEYGALVDRRELTHSGEPVGVLLGRPGDAHADALLEPVLERYAFVLPDAFDSMGRFKPRAELGRLWPEGGKEPAWVELLRARHYVVESDGAGGLRAFLPVPRGTSNTASAAAAEVAWKDAWPVLRHVLAAERRRRPGKLAVEVYPYVHELSGARFRVGITAWRTEVEDTEKGAAPPLDLDGWTRFLERGMTLAGARLAGPGEVRLLGDAGGTPPTLLGRPLALSDLAAAWRAVAHGGLAEPYMSLDRGVSPWTTRVSYGGRLRDTALGLVSLRCDIRFKTFSLGLAPDGNGDLRERLRAAIPGFRTHLERFAADATASGTWSQQTRLWFYPDDVELGLSASGDALVIARARMTAASERQDVRKDAEASEPNWTRETVAAINHDYAALAQTLPELHDLDEVVRVLALATWLQQARADGLPVPDLDVLLDVELPAEPTPRTWPQILAVNGLPGAPGGGQVEVIERGDVGRALQRLDPAQGSLPARQRLERAVGRLDPTRADHAALLRDVQALPAGAEPGTVDLLAWRAERLAMHALVLGTLPEASRARLADKRLFSVGIGGLDLGMSGALAKASRRGLDLRGARGAAPTPARATASTPPATATSSIARFSGPIPAHGFPPATTDCPSPFQDGTRVLRFDGSCHLDAVERREGERTLAFRFEPSGTTWTARVVPTPAQVLTQPGSQPAGLAVLTVARRQTETGSDTVAVRLQGNGLDRAADLPRRGLQRLLLGQELAPAGSATLPGLVPPPPEMGHPDAWMVWAPDLVTQDFPGEEDPIRLADALRAASLPVVLGLGAEAPTRWARAPRVGRALLVVPEDGFPGVAAPRRDAVVQAWGKAPRATALPERKLPDLVVLLSAEAPAMLAARAMALASDPRLAGRHLAVLSLGGNLPPALTADLLDRGPAGVAVSAASLEDVRALGATVARLGKGSRAETLPGLGVWTYGISGSQPPAEPATQAPPSPSRRSRR